MKVRVLVPILGVWSREWEVRNMEHGMELRVWPVQA